MEDKIEEDLESIDWNHLKRIAISWESPIEDDD